MERGTNSPGKGASTYTQSRWPNLGCVMPHRDPRGAHSHCGGASRLGEGLSRLGEMPSRLGEGLSILGDEAFKPGAGVSGLRAGVSRSKEDVFSESVSLQPPSITSTSSTQTSVDSSAVSAVRTTWGNMQRRVVKKQRMKQNL